MMFKSPLKKVLSLLLISTTAYSQSMDGLLFSHTQESFQSARIDNNQVILSVLPLLNIGSVSTVGGLYETPVFLYAEDVFLDQTFSFQGGVISAHQITGQNTPMLEASGANGSPQEPDQSSSINGTNGHNLGFYVESMDPDTFNIAFNAQGGNGGNAITDSSNTGGNGGNGGNVTVVAVHPYLNIIDDLDDLQDAQLTFSKQLPYLTQILKKIDSHKSLYSVSRILNRAITILNDTIIPEKNLTDQDIIDFYNSLFAIPQILQNDVNNWGPTINVGGGAYGLGGDDVNLPKEGPNGQPGFSGTSFVVPIVNASAFPSTSGQPFFLFSHPSQCAMLLEKAKLQYMIADPISDPQSVKNVAVLLQRLDQRLANFINMTQDNPMAQLYSTHESSIGALNSLENFKDLYHTTQTLMNYLKSGLDFFGKQQDQVPILSFQYYNSTFNTMVGYFNAIELAYNQYYEQFLKDTQSLETIKEARSNLSSFMDNTPCTINLLNDELISNLSSFMDNTPCTINLLNDELTRSMDVIDSYQMLLPTKRHAAEQSLKAVEQAIQSHFDFSWSDLISAFGMISFAPKSPLAWIDGAASVLHTGISKVTSDSGITTINKKYLIQKIKSIGSTLESLKEGYSMANGFITPDDPNALKLIAEKEDIDAIINKFYDSLGSSSKEIKKNVMKTFDDYISCVQNLNDHIMRYNVILHQIDAQEASYNQAKTNIKTLDDNALNLMASDLNAGALAVFMSQTYYSARSYILNLLDDLERSYRFWALQDSYVIANMYANGLPAVDSSTLLAAQLALLQDYTDALTQYNTNSNSFPVSNLLNQCSYTCLTLNASDVNLLPLLNQTFVKITPENTCNLFNGMANIRLTRVRAWLEGIDAPQNSPVSLLLTHTGTEKIIDQSGNNYIFQHNPKSVEFKYYGNNLETNSWTILQDGDIGDLDSDYALVGPFTDWSIKLVSATDLSSLSGIKMEFHGTSYASQALNIPQCNSESDSSSENDSGDL